ncbi:MAG: OmpA family protein [Flavobacteriales bacterium]|nr:OmpA family protein [Flavobacteriales bacterium]
MKTRLYLSTVLSIFIISSVNAQDVPFDKSLFKEKKEEFKVAKEKLDIGYTAFQMYPETFMDFNNPEFRVRASYHKEALQPLFDANQFNPDNAQLNYRLGRCYLASPIYKEESLKHFLKAQKLNANVSKDISYYIGIGYQLNLKFDEAIAAYKSHRGILTTKDALEIEDTEKKIRECETGKKLVAKPVRAFIDNIGDVINSKYPEYGAIISADESVMMFTSRRNTSTGGLLDEGLNEYYEDIYITTKTNGKWNAPQNMGTNVNTEMHDATVAVAPDAQSMIIYKGDKGNGDLFECKLTGSSWSKPVPLSKNVNTKYHESSASYSNDAKTLYFVSNKPGGFGEHDIYFSKWDELKKEWGVAVNIGPSINTKYNEESVVIHPDGKTIYFSSQGHESMGGFDIFMSRQKEDGTWGTPENIGYPINSVHDDVFFVVNASGRKGYYSSFKPDGFGEKDIYLITFLGPEKPVQLIAEDNLLANIAEPVREKIVEKQVDAATKRITILKGVVRDAKTLAPLYSDLELIDVEENKTLAKFESNASTGKYLVSLPSGKNYGLIVRADGYLFHSENFNIPETAAYQEVEKNIDLQKIEVGSSIILKNIFYDYNKSTLRDASKNELDRLVKLLNDNPTLKIELSAHTDSRGGDKYNDDLSQRRAQSCVDYLINAGIASGRLISKGYGKQKLLISDAEIAKLKFEDEKEDAHQQNRRTEFKIVGK